MGILAKCGQCSVDYVADRQSRRFCSLACSAKHIGDLARRPLADRFWEKVDKGAADACWDWIGARAAVRYLGGYGIIMVVKGQSPVGAHRVSWELHNGPIPPGMLVCHKCDNPSCTNPKHLFLGTVQDNSIDCARKGRVRGGMPKGKARGTRNPQAKLSDVAVLEIRTAYAGGGVTYFDLAARHGVTYATIGSIVRGDHWQHVGGPRGGRAMAKAA